MSTSCFKNLSLSVSISKIHVDIHFKNVSLNSLNNSTLFNNVLISVVFIVININS